MYSKLSVDLDLFRGLAMGYTGQLLFIGSDRKKEESLNPTKDQDKKRIKQVLIDEVQAPIHLDLVMQFDLH